jgi:hypothetical protein
MPGGPSLAALTISGPDTVPPSGTGQFTVSQRFSDGSTSDGTAEATWHSSNDSVLQLSPTGLATGRDRGEADVIATIGRMSATKHVMVVPTGTFRLEGRLTDAGHAIPGAAITVTAGQGAGLSADAGSGGFLLYGVAGPIELRARANGYSDLTHRVTVSAHQSVNLEMTPAAAREQVAGRYTLRISAASSCAARLPEEARVRTYTADVTQDGPNLIVTVGGAQFLSQGPKTYNRFGGIVQPNRVLFTVIDPDAYYYYGNVTAIRERLTANAPNLVWIGGTVTTTASGRVRSGALNGQMLLVNETFRVIATCEAEDHGFALSR